jgi:hypothetical protein
MNSVSIVTLFEELFVPIKKPEECIKICIGLSLSRILNKARGKAMYTLPWVD